MTWRRRCEFRMEKKWVVTKDKVMVPFHPENPKLLVRQENSRSWFQHGTNHRHNQNYITHSCSFLEKK
jgi:hypothetical protein